MMGCPAAVEWPQMARLVLLAALAAAQATARPNVDLIMVDDMERYKFCGDGRFYDVPHDWKERRPLGIEEATPEAPKIRAELQRVLHSMPAWKPRGGGSAGP